MKMDKQGNAAPTKAGERGKELSNRRGNGKDDGFGQNHLFARRTRCVSLPE